MYIAVVQNNPTLGDLENNCKCALATIDMLAAEAYPPDLVVFPAFALTGAPICGLQNSDAFAAQCLNAFHEFISKAALPTLIGTMIPRPLAEEMGFTSEPEVLYCKDGKGGAVGFVDENDEWVYGRYTESISMLIDGQIVRVYLDEYPDRNDDLSDCDALILMLSKEYRGTNTLFTSSTQQEYLKEIAQKNKAWVVVANLVGAQDSTVFDGASLAIDSNGEVAASALPFVEETFLFNINFGDKGDKTLIDDVVVDEKPPPTTVKPLLPYEADWRAICLFTKDYMQKCGFSHAVLGLSGGIDSAVSAVVACDALGCEQVHGLLMPSQFTSKESLNDARELAANLGISTHEVSIEELTKIFAQTSMAVIGGEGTALAQQNIQARIRMLILMHFSNTFGWMVINTSNKSERAMGYSTLYGDSGGALSPLGNIYKTDVYGLANWRNERSLVIPQNSIDKEPSAELCMGQKDSDNLPPYDMLDHILRMHIDEGLSLDQILEYTPRGAFGDALTKKLIEQVLNAVRLAEYKRRQEPLAPTLGYVDMNEDRDWPIVNGFKDRSLIDGLPRNADDYLSMIQSWKMPDGWGFLAN